MRVRLVLDLDFEDLEGGEPDGALVRDRLDRLVGRSFDDGLITEDTNLTVESCGYSVVIDPAMPLAEVR